MRLNFYSILTDDVISTKVATLPSSRLNAFFDEAERVLTELNVPLQVVTDRGKGAKP
jgi:hypothetical protein